MSAYPLNFAAALIVKIKVVIQVVLCVLLGLMTRAEGPQFKKQTRATTDNTRTNLACLMAATGHQDDNDSFASRAPVHRHVRHKTRFRAVSPYTVALNQPGGASRNFDHLRLSVPLAGSNTGRILPFYYIFLFRFTPF